MKQKHSWIDVSYHGSPIYQCRYCDAWETDVKSNTSCPKANEYLANEKLRTELQERREHSELILRLAREKYLLDKYGNE